MIIHTEGLQKCMWCGNRRPLGKTTRKGSRRKQHPFWEFFPDLNTLKDKGQVQAIIPFKADVVPSSPNKATREKHSEPVL